MNSLDVLECPKCSGRMRILAINPPEAIRKILIASDPFAWRFSKSECPAPARCNRSTRLELPPEDIGSGRF